jgi:two-component system, OmpR family, response regulator
VSIESMEANILIVETDPVFRENLAKRLSGDDCRILHADRITEAKKMVKRNNIDVVLLGLTSLKQEGLAILKMIKRIRPLTEVITINSSGQIALSIEGMKLGAFDDFMDPFTIDSLAGRIHEAWIQKRQREKKTKPLLHRAMDIMAAVAFAEAGEHDMALAYLENEEQPASELEKKGDENGKD